MLQNYNDLYLIKVQQLNSVPGKNFEEKTQLKASLELLPSFALERHEGDTFIDDINDLITMQ